MKQPNSETATAGAKSIPRTPTKPHLSRDGRWKYFPTVPNLIQYVVTETFYARAKVKGKSIRKSLETSKFDEARRLLPAAVAKIRDTAPPLGTFAEARLKYEIALKADHTLAPGTLRYRQFCLGALEKTWPELALLQVRKITVEDCREWATRFLGAGYDEQYFNNSLGTIRAVLQEAGIRRDDNPGFKIKRLGVKPKQLQLPEAEQFEQIVKAIEDSGFPRCGDRADLVRFLAYSGCRISEAAEVQWEDVDFQRGKMRVRTAKRALTSGASKDRYVPILPDMLKLLLRLQDHRARLRTELGVRALKEHGPRFDTHVCVALECEKSLTSACKKVGATRITHHDLRHLFATRCIEAGVDIPTVSRWLGHLDGGALAMKVYGHLRWEHSAAMAQRVTFGTAPANVVQLPLIPKLEAEI